nr:tripartite motif-containing protein 59-like [Procambarus clarkii]
MMDNKPEECSVCFNDYDDNQLRPRTLLCGHTFCSQCIDNAIKNGQLTCPSCRAEHAATAATQFPINYAVEAFVRKLKNIQLTTEEAVPAKPYEGPARGISKKLRSLVQEQKSIISSLITSCEEVLSQLGEYRGQLGDWKTHHLQLQDRLYALVEQNKSAMKLLELEDTSVVDMTTQGEEGKTQLQAMLGNLDTVNTPQEVDTTIDTADECSMKVEDWLQKCQELFPNVKTVHTSVKVQETIREALEMMTTETGATADPVHLGDSASSIMNKVQEITGEIPQKQLTVEDLRRMNEPVKRLVEAGRVVAVKRLLEASRVLVIQKDQDGHRCFARITLQDGKLYLHPLLRQPTPAHAHTIQESEVVGMLEPSCTLAFLDLGWAGSTRGRVTIRLTPDTPLARQFVLLCTGQRAHTYRNTKLLSVGDKGQPGEYVAGGDYESNDGEGGAQLLPNLSGSYRESRREGTVRARCGLEGPKSAQFIITTRELQRGTQWLKVFGDVVSGLDVVRAAVNHSDITEVTVVDCGVVLPL